MIFETIVSTLDKNKEINFAPFGIKKSKNTILISPFVPSKTLNNLKENKFAVVNYTDRSEFFVDCIVGKIKFKKEKCKNFPGFFINDALSFDQVTVKKILPDKIRPVFVCEINKSYQLKRFEGHNRARSAIIEACILASRVKMLPKDKIMSELEYLNISVSKTAGDSEKKSWKKISNFINSKINEK